MEAQIPYENHNKLLGEKAKSRDSIFAQNVVKEKLMKAYGSKIEVDFSETRIEESEDGRRFFWVVEGKIAVRKRLFWKKAYRFLCYVSAETGNIAFMRGKRA